MKIKRCPLSKRTPRDLVKNCGKYLGMILILVCTISIGSAFQSTRDGALRHLANIKEDNLQEDGFFELAEQLSSDDKQYFQNKKIDLCENFFVSDKTFKKDSTILVFDERKNIDIPVVFEGKLPHKQNEIAIDHVYARTRKIKIGDTIKVKDKNFTVSGTVSMPDYQALFLNNTDIVMNTSHFCVAVVNSEAFKCFDQNIITYRYSYRFENRDLNEAKQTKNAEDMQKHLVESGKNLQSFLTSFQNQSISFIQTDIGADGPFMTVFVYMLVALIAFVFAILTNSTIESEAVIIGTLLASGYKKSEIIWHYLQPTFIVALAGSVIGNVLGYTVMISPFLDMFHKSYSVGPIDVQFSTPAFISTTCLPVVIMVVINLFMLIQKLSLSPLKFLRRDIKKKKQKVSIKLPNFNFLTRFRLRVILQNKGSYIMLFIGIFLASFLLMFGIGLSPLMNHYTESVDESLPFNYEYFLKAPVDNVNEDEKVYTYEMKTWFNLGQKDITVSLMGINDNSTFFKNALTDDGVCISSALSKKMNLKVGDTLKLTDKSNDKSYKLKISKIYQYDASMAAFFKLNDLNKMLGNDSQSYNSILSNKKLDIDNKYIAKELSRADLLGAADQMMSSFETVILFINIFSVIVYIVLMYILTKVVIDKNALSISFMKVFGYEPKEIRKIYLTATTIVVISSLIICIPLEIELFKLTLVFISSLIDGYIAFYLPYSIYFEIVIIGIVSYLLINAIHIKGIEKIPMSDALKNRE